MKETMRLGQLIRLLEAFDVSRDVFFNFAYFTPTSLDSYRGYYEDLALGFGEEPVTVGALLVLLRSARGETFEGYKGGSYRMSDETHVWVARRGECPHTTLVGVQGGDSGPVILLTGYDDG